MVVAKRRDVTVKPRVNYCGLKSIGVCLRLDESSLWIVDVVELSFVSVASNSRFRADARARVDVEVDPVFKPRIRATVQASTLCPFETSSIVFTT